MSEFSLIARIAARASTRTDVVLGIGDDAALLQPPADCLLAIAQDTLNVGVHFPVDSAAADIGWKALAVNLSDLAAMGAEPAWCLLSLSLPEASADWLDGFFDGFAALAARHDVALVGGDTTRGPLSISVAVHGFVPPGAALTRRGARPDDDLWITGSTGAAAAALRLRALGRPVDPALQRRLDRPTPRVAAGRALRGLASSAIDISDGLLADLGHVLDASGVGARIEIAALPLAEGLRDAVAETERWELQLAGGDDYELCFTAAPDRRAAIEAALQRVDTPASRIGRIVAGAGCAVVAPDGTRWTPTQAGYEHFRTAADGTP